MTAAKARESAEQKKRAADSRLRWRFGILPEAKGGPSGSAGVERYDRMLAEQSGLCAICKVPPKPGKRFAVDHNHSSGRIRGLLCSVCNGRVLGRLERFKNRLSLNDLLQYLKKFDPENILLRGLKEGC